jgi:phosphoadenosine phosphosulfate reductase
LIQRIKQIEMVDYSLVADLNTQADEANLVGMLKNVAGKFPGKVVFTTSLGIEYQVITDMIFGNNLDIRVVTLDTGRLFEETYKVMNRTIEKYGKQIEVYFPKNDAVEKMVTAKGPLSFYLSVENRKECCHIRKVEPLTRALEGMECWRDDGDTGRRDDARDVDDGEAGRDGARLAHRDGARARARARARPAGELGSR